MKNHHSLFPFLSDLSEDLPSWRRIVSRKLAVIACIFSALIPFAQSAEDVPPTAPRRTEAKAAAVVNAGTGYLDDSRILAPDDLLSFRIAEEEGDPVLVKVSTSGEIDFPYVGRVQASGRTCKAVAVEVRRLLEKSFYRKATVGLALETASTLPMGTYFISGQVITQGAQEIPRDRQVTVAEAILKAGGFADFADQRRVRLIRPLPGGKTEKFTVDVKAVLERGAATKDRVIQPGDYIVVPERLFNF